MFDDAGPTPLRVLVLGPSAPAALVTMRCVEALGHAVELRGDLAEAAALVRDGGWDAVVVDLDGLAEGAPEALRTLAASAAVPPVLLGTALEADPLDLLAWSSAGLDRVVPPHCESDAWRLALDRRLPRGFDPQPLHRLRELDEQVCRDSVQALLDDTPRKLELIRGALHRRDPLAARRAAHALKGGASQLGALRLASLCSRIESELAGDVFDTAQATCEVLLSVWRETEPWLAGEAGA